jgi:phage terminase small subunit
MYLTQKQEAFSLAYLETGNASEAYRRAYDAAKMKANTVEKRACELMKLGKVTGRIAELRAQVAKKAVLNRAWVLERLMRNARIAMGEERIKVAVRPKAAPDTVVELEITDRDAGAANRALELLGKADEVRLFTEQPTKDLGPLETTGPPRDPVKDHLEGLSKRFANGLKAFEGGSAPSGLNGSRALGGRTQRGCCQILRPARVASTAGQLIWVEK